MRSICDAILVLCLQEAGLMPHFSVAGNVGLVPSLLGWEQERIDQRVQEMMELVGLDAGEIC
jgi:osmoprotectant transport system ATP-binding protein